jgi:hypothetical protein
MSANIVSGQNSRLVSVAPSNQTQFTPGQKCIIDLDESLGYVKGRDSYLAIDIQNTSTNKDRWTFPNGVGASALIQRLDFYSRATGQLLESLPNYNQIVGIENQYIKDDYKHDERTEAVGSPINQYVNAYLSAGAEYSKVANLDPSDIANNLVSPLNEDGTNAYVPRRLCVPLKSGLFSRWWDTEKLCPVMNFGGLRVEITWAPVGQVCKRMGYKNSSSIAGADNFIVRNTVEDPIELSNVLAGNVVSTNPAKERGYFTSLHDTGLCVGNKIDFTYKIAGADTVVSNRTITALATGASPGVVDITFDGDPVVAGDTGAPNNTGKLNLNLTTNPSYKVDSVELRVLQMVVPKDGMDKLAKPMKYEFTSYDHHLNTLPTGVLRHQVPVNSVASKARCMLTHFTNATTEEDLFKMSYYSGVKPLENNLNSVQYFINNKLYPLQAYNPGNKNDKPLTLNELVKALSSINKSPQNLGDAERGNLNDYSNTFLLSRELARGDYVFDLRNAEPEIRLGFSATRADVNRLNTFVFSRKVVDVSPQGLMVEL